MTIKFLDIGLGVSTLIETDEINIIFDCGIDNETGKNCFKELGKKELDYLIITHPHKDHIGALASPYYNKPSQLTRNMNIHPTLIEEQINNGNEHDKIIFKEYKELNNAYSGIPDETISYYYPQNNGNVTLKHFIPSKQDSNELNDYSIATFLSYKGYKIFLMGDNTPKNIEELMEDNDLKSKIENIDVLLAPHHGRESCYVSEFVKHLNPKITIISDKPEDNNESASGKYGDNSRGMFITKNGKREFRSCITTRNDGDITLTITDSNNLSISCSK